MLLQVYVLREAVAKIRELPTPERKLISEVISVCKLILVNPAASDLLKDRFPLPKD